MSNIEADLNFVKIDLILAPWAKARGLFVSREFSESDDRFIQVLDDAGDSYGLWVAPRGDGSVSVVIAENAVSGVRMPDYKARTEKFTTELAGLGQALNRAYTLAESWMQERGHMRTMTPVLLQESI